MVPESISSKEKFLTKKEYAINPLAVKHVSRCKDHVSCIIEYLVGPSIVVDGDFNTVCKIISTGMGLSEAELADEAWKRSCE